MAYHVAIAQFEGPLDLLVQLVEANQLEVTAISAAAVTEQFLAIVEKLGDDRLGEIGLYLDLAARLLVVKSLALLPGAQETEPGLEIARLESELELYRQNQLRARQLAKRWGLAGRSYTRPVPAAPVRPANLPETASLLAIYRKLIDSQPAWETETAPKLTLAHMLTRVQDRLASQPLPLHRMMEESDCPSDVALLLVAVLELVKNRRVAVHQPEPFGAIMVSPHA